VRIRFWVTLSVALCTLASPSGPSASASGVPADVRRALGPGTVAIGNGHYRTTLPDGHRLTTHGPDPIPQGEQQPVAAAAPRTPYCATDYYQQILYGYQTGGTNRLATVKSQIVEAVRNMNGQLNQDSIASGGPTADYKVLCDAFGDIDVQAFSATGPDFYAIGDGARAAGFDRSNVDYTIFWDGTNSGYCGVGSFVPDERGSALNWNNGGGAYAVTYSNCWNGTTPQHENGHNQGAVQYEAPYSTGSGAHCWDESDVMCYSPDGGDKHQDGTISRCTDRTYFDCGFDTYFDSAPEAGEYLASNWNIGASYNRFVVFGAEAGNLPPAAGFTVSCTGLQCSFQDASSDVDGTIVSRSWDLGDGTTSTATSFTHAYPSTGAYVVTLTVTDDGDLTGARTQHVVTPTTPAIAEPAEGATVVGGTVQFAGTGPPGAAVLLREGGSTFASLTANGSGLWSGAVPMPEGDHAVTAISSTPVGTSSPSAVRTFTVRAQTTDDPPIVDRPADGALTKGLVVVSGTAAFASRALFYDEAGKLVGAASVAADGRFTGYASFKTGERTLTVVPEFPGGALGTPSAPVHLTVDATAPLVSISTPATYVQPLAFLASGEVTDNRDVVAVTVEIYDGIRGGRVGKADAALESLGDGTYRWSAGFDLLPGRYTIRASAIDGVGNQSLEASRTITYV